MDVRPPHGIDPAAFDRLKAEEKARAEDLQRQGTWVHLWCMRPSRSWGCYGVTRA